MHSAPTARSLLARLHAACRRASHLGAWLGVSVQALVAASLMLAGAELSFASAPLAGLALAALGVLVGALVPRRLRAARRAARAARWHRRLRRGLRPLRRERWALVEHVRLPSQELVDFVALAPQNELAFAIGAGPGRPAEATLDALAAAAALIERPGRPCIGVYAAATPGAREQLEGGLLHAPAEAIAASLRDARAGLAETLEEIAAEGEG